MECNGMEWNGILLDVKNALCIPNMALLSLDIDSSSH